MLDDMNEWKGQPANWENTRWTGVTEKRDGKWVIVQQHFSFAVEQNLFILIFPGSRFYFLSSHVLRLSLIGLKFYVFVFELFDKSRHIKEKKYIIIH